MQVKANPEDSKSYLSLNTIDGGITITDGVNGKFKVDPTLVDIPSDVYFYDIQVVFPTSVVKTYIRGSFTVIQDVTRLNS